MGKKFLFGLRGKALNQGLIWSLIFPAYTLFGWNLGIAGSLIDLPAWVAQFPSIDTLKSSDITTSDIQGTVVALYPLGAMFGALSCILNGDRLGRLHIIGLGASVQIIGAILECTSFSLGQLIVARIVTGYGFGALSATAPNWQSECSTADHRGSVVLLESLFISLGLALQEWVTLGVSFAEGSVTWRFPLAMSIFWALLVLAALPLVPESPRWLVKKGRVDEARNVVAALLDVDTASAEVDDSIAEIEETVAIPESRFVDIFKNSTQQRLLNRTGLAMLSGMFQQICGINALGFYLSAVFQEDLKLASTISRILGASVYTFQTLCSPIGVLTVDRFGRRKLMLVSALGMGSCMFLIAGTSSQINNMSAIAAAGAFIFLFSLFFPVGFLGLSFLYSAEVSPLNARSYITGMSTGTVWLTTFLVTEITPVASANIAWRYYFVYGCTNFFFIIPLVYFFFPETNGRSQEEMDAIFRDSKSIFDPVKISRALPRHPHKGAAEPVKHETEEKEEVAK